MQIMLKRQVGENSYVNEDEEFRFDGATGDTYLKYNSTSGKLEMWVDGVLKWQL